MAQKLIRMIKSKRTLYLLAFAVFPIVGGYLGSDYILKPADAPAKPVVQASVDDVKAEVSQALPEVTPEPEAQQLAQSAPVVPEAKLTDDSEYVDINGALGRDPTSFGQAAEAKTESSALAAASLTTTKAPVQQASVTPVAQARTVTTPSAPVTEVVESPTAEVVQNHPEVIAGSEQADSAENLDLAALNEALANEEAAAGGTGNPISLMSSGFGHGLGGGAGAPVSDN